MCLDIVTFCPSLELAQSPIYSILNFLHVYFGPVIHKNESACFPPPLSLSLYPYLLCAMNMQKNLRACATLGRPANGHAIRHPSLLRRPTPSYFLRASAKICWPLNVTGMRFKMRMNKVCRPRQEAVTEYQTNLSIHFVLWIQGKTNESDKFIAQV